MPRTHGVPTEPMCHRRSRWIFAIGVAVHAALAPFARTQTPAPLRLPLFGIVRDSTGAALPGVTIAIPGAFVLSDARGRFELFTANVDTVSISFRRLGFEPIDARLRKEHPLWDTVFVQMTAMPRQLKSVDVKESMSRGAMGMRGFEDRQRRGNGQFITRAEIAARGSYRLSDVLRTKRGVNVVRGGKVRFVAFTAGRSTMCQPDIWLDGVRTLGMEVDELLPSTVEAIELYANFSTIPIEFQPVGANTTPCGTIVMWTRIPDGQAK